MKTAVISMCSLKHREVWKRTSTLLIQNLEADSFRLYVPEDEIGLFEKYTPERFSIMSQERLGAAFSGSLRRAVTAAGNSERYGWYLQQFLKIEALIQSRADLSVIWDADCVPVRTIRVLDSSDTPLFMQAGEFHPPYFDMIMRLLGLSRVQSQSFVIPAFPIKNNWISDLVTAIQERSEIPWYEAIIAATDFRLRSGFSETETMGTWIANRYPGEWATTQYAWERHGQSRFGRVSRFTSEDLEAIGAKKELDIISFENWDRRGVRKSIDRIWSKITRNADYW